MAISSRSDRVGDSGRTRDHGSPSTRSDGAGRSVVTSLGRSRPADIISKNLVAAATLRRVETNTSITWPCWCHARRAVLQRRSTTVRSGGTSGRPTGSRPAGTGSRRTRQKQNDHDDESPGHATTRTRSVNATVPADLGNGSGPLDSTTRCCVVGLPRIELGTSSLSGMRSNRLSYSPGKSARLSDTTHDRTRVIDHGLANDRAGVVAIDRGNLGFGPTHDKPPHR